MNMKKIAGAVAVATLALGLSAPASAVVLTAGDLKLTFNSFDSGTTGYGTTDGIKCTTATGCDKVAQNAPRGVGSEDTWGIFSIQSISRVSDGGLIFTAGNGQYLTGVFGGIADTLVNVSGEMAGLTQTLALGTGGWLNMYLNTTNYNAAQGPNGRIGTTGYNGITNIGGELALSAVFAGGAVKNRPDYTYASSFANDTISGSGQGFLDVTGGSLAKEFNTNAQIDPNGNAHDLFLKVTYGQTGASLGAGWTVDASGDVQGEVVLPTTDVPEPASLALFGLGLAGLAALRRRRA